MTIFSLGVHNCNEGSQRCDNTFGSYVCVRYIPCGTGYTFNGLSGKCEDDDECALGLHDCESRGPAYFCRNIQGSFRCDLRKCADGEALNEVTGKCQPVICTSGYKPGPFGQCIDIDECENNPCNPFSETCQNTLGSYNCLTVCAKGLQLSNGQCVDVGKFSKLFSTFLRKKY